MTNTKPKKVRKKGESQDINIKKFDGNTLDYIEKTGVPVSKFILMACEEKIQRDSK